MYSERLMEEFFNPDNFGVIKGASGVGKVVSDVGSEIIKIYIMVEEGKVTEATYQAFGGPVLIACANVAVKQIVGKEVKSLAKFQASDITSVVGEIPEDKQYLLQAVVSAVKGAEINYKNKQGK